MLGFGNVVLWALACQAFGMTLPTVEEPAFPPATQTTLSPERNMERLFHIRNSFQKHAVLGSLNIGLDYKDGVLVLWGPVPSRERLDLAISFGKTQKGVFEVRSQMYVGKTGDRPGGEANGRLPEEPPLRVQAASPGPTLVMPRGLPEAEPKQAFSTGFPGVGPTPVQSAPNPVRSGQVLRLPQEQLPGSSTPIPVANRVEIESKPVPLPVASPSEKLLLLRSSQGRFQSINWILKGDQVEIHFPENRSEAAFEFASYARKLEGIRSLVMKPRPPE